MKPLSRMQCLLAVDALLGLDYQERRWLEEYLRIYQVHKAAKKKVYCVETASRIGELLWPKLFIGELKAGPMPKRRRAKGSRNG
jgi:hypothetical protein